MQTATLNDAEPRTGSSDPLLVLQRLDKRFGATHALKHVDLDFMPGEIHAIVGETALGSRLSSNA